MKQNIEVDEIRKELILLRIKQTKLMARARCNAALNKQIYEEDQVYKNHANIKKMETAIKAYHKANNEATVLERQIQDLSLLLESYKK